MCYFTCNTNADCQPQDRHGTQSTENAAELPRGRGQWRPRNRRSAYEDCGAERRQNEGDSGGYEERHRRPGKESGDGGRQVGLSRKYAVAFPGLTSAFYALCLSLRVCVKACIFVRQGRKLAIFSMICRVAATDGM